MHQFRCPDRRILREFLVGAISDDKADDIERHLAGCRACLNAARVLVPADAFLDALRAGVAAGGLSPDDVDEELLSRLCQLGQQAGAASRADRTRTVDDFLEPAQFPGELGRFASYQVLRSLGRGGMGVVYLARQQRPARLVALKILAGVPLSDGQRLARFRAEADVLAGLHHPNVVQVYEAGEHAGLPYYTMEYLEGGSLAGKLAESPLPAGEAARLLETLARAVHAAHERGILHRDLKPSNVLVAGSGVPKVSDFGLAKQLPVDGNGAAACHTDTGAILGTPGYMAPEQFTGTGDSGPAVDIYALGAILYETLTGRPPFKGATALDTLEQSRNRDPIPPSRLQPGIPRDLQALCLKCLEKTPRRRYASAKELADDLARFLRGEPTRARPLGAIGRAVKLVRRRPALAGFALFALIAAVGWSWGVVIHNAQLRREVQRSAASEAEAQRQRRLAAENYRAARDALNRVLEQLQRSSSANIPRVKELQRNVLKETVAFYEGAARDRSEVDPALALDMAVAYHRIAKIQWELADHDAARASARKSQALAEQLVAVDPANAAYQHSLGSAYVSLASFGSGADPAVDRRQKVEGFKKALRIYERLIELHPENADWRHQLAIVEHDLGGLFFEAGQVAEASAYYSKAMELRRPLVEHSPEQAQYKAALAEDQLCLGLAESQLGRSAPATRRYEEANRLLQSLVQADPQHVHYVMSLAALYINWAYLLAADGSPQRALDLLGEGIRRTKAILEQEPSDQIVRERLLNLHGARAEINASLQRYPQTIPDWEAVVALENRIPLQVPRRLALATALARAGEHLRAVAETSKLIAGQNVAGDTLYGAACVFALCVPAARAGSQRSVHDREKLAEQYAARAMELLERLRCTRYFADVQHRQNFEKDTDLQAVRGRGDFQVFLKKLGGS
jgi:serine/threonine-protein kinase